MANFSFKNSTQPILNIIANFSTKSVNSPHALGKFFLLCKLFFAQFVRRVYRFCAKVCNDIEFRNCGKKSLKKLASSVWRLKTGILPLLVFAFKFYSIQYTTFFCKWMCRANQNWIYKWSLGTVCRSRCAWPVFLCST